MRPCAPLVHCSAELCPVVLCFPVLLWYPVPLRCLVCCLCLCACSSFKNHCKILYKYFSLSLSLQGVIKLLIQSIYFFYMV